MKITKLISYVLVFLIVLNCFSAVYAQNLVDERGNVNCIANFDISEFGYSIATETGDEFIQFTDNFNRYVAVMCLKAEDYITDLSIYSDDEIKNMAVYFGGTLMEDDGDVTASFRLPSRSGKYTIIFINGILGNLYVPFEYESKLYFDYDDALEMGKDSVLSFIEDNIDYIPVNKVGYNLLSDEEKGKLVDILIDNGEVDNIDEFNTVFSSLPVENAIFQNTDIDTMLEYINESADEEYSSFNQSFVDIYLEKIDEEESDENKKAILDDFVGKTVDDSMISDFKFAVLKSYVDLFEYFSQMEDVLVKESNIWGFEQADVETYNLLSNKNNVMNEMMDKLDNAASLEAYIEAFGDIVDAQKKTEDESKNSYNSSGSSSSSRGGSSGGSGFTIKADSTAINTEDKKEEIVVSKPNFEDLIGFEWAADAINTLKNNGIINGVTEKSFSPANFVKREEFVKMICSAMKITGVEYDVDFSDTDKDAWYYNSICAAVRAQIIKGVSDTEFGIGQNISRQDAAVIIKRIYDLKNIKIEKVTEISFNDENKISDYAYDSVKKLVSTGIINGYEDLTFRPSATLTRAEAAVVIHKFMLMADMLDK